MVDRVKRSWCVFLEKEKKHFNTNEFSVGRFFLEFRHRRDSKFWLDSSRDSRLFRSLPDPEKTERRFKRHLTSDDSNRTSRSRWPTTTGSMTPRWRPLPPFGARRSRLRWSEARDRETRLTSDLSSRWLANNYDPLPIYDPLICRCKSLAALLISFLIVVDSLLMLDYT